MSIALGISASAREISVALRLADSSTRLAVRPNSRAANDLTAVAAALCREHGVAPTELAELRVDVGPGSYTGLRIAITFVRVIAAFQDLPLFTTTSLELMALAAWNAGSEHDNTTIRPVLDARRQRFHHAPVTLSGTTRLAAPPRATELAELAAAVQPDETLLAAEELHEPLRKVLDTARFIEPLPWDATLLFDPRIEMRRCSTDEIEPLYLMGSYAE